ncbi:MAG TPA: hypothetical protein VNW73_06190 [Ktedonobacteraceae bacterium]|jgi:hypothetical protein|nr:hypothetical protein [Ktedonobacteraceae bacterium]
MKDQNFSKSKQQEPFDLEKRLATFYDHQLREQPLSQASWQNLLHRLGSQEETKRRQRFSLHFPRKRSRVYVPTSIQDTFTRIAYEARIASRSSMLSFSLNPHIREPMVRYSRFCRRKIRLIFPLNAIATIGQSEIDVLLATGLARSICAHKPIYVLVRLILVSVVLIACLAMILSWIHHVPLVGFPIAIALYVSIVWLMQMQSRSIAFHADALMVLWLGRGRICNGLQALADHSRTPRRKRWGEPSLAERIKRVCGTGVDVKNNDLTLVR